MGFHMTSVAASQSDAPVIESLLGAFNELLKKPDDSSWVEDVFSQCLKIYGTNRKIFNRDFYTITLDSHPDVNTLAEQILVTLNIDPLIRTRYLNMPLTLHAFLVELNELTEKKNGQLNKFIQLINQHNTTQWKGIVIGTIIGTAIGLFPMVMYELSGMQQFVTVASIISSGGLAYAVGMAIYTLHEYNTSKKVSYFQLFRDNFFSMTNAAINIVAWSLLLTAAVTNPIISILFVIADFVLVIKEFVSLSYFFHQNKKDTNFNPTLSEQQLQIREQINFEKNRHAAWVHFTAAVVLTIIIAAWCFVPGGIFVAAACMLAMGVVYATKQYAISKNEAAMKVELVKKFSEIELVEKRRCEPQVRHEIAPHLDEDKTFSMIDLQHSDSLPHSNVYKGLNKMGMFNNNTNHGVVNDAIEANACTKSGNEPN